MKVYAPPAAGILSTGSELKDLYCRGEAGPLRVSSNAAYLRSLLMTAGIRHIHAAAAPDDENAIAAKLSELAHRCGFIFTIGGTGGGQRDLTRRAILLAGGRIFEERSCAGGVPPFISGEIDGVPLLGLPGNPLGASAHQRPFWGRHPGAPDGRTLRFARAGLLGAYGASGGKRNWLLETLSRGWRRHSPPESDAARRRTGDRGALLQLMESTSRMMFGIGVCLNRISRKIAGSPLRSSFERVYLLV